MASGSSAGTGTPCCSARPVALPSPEGEGSSYHKRSWYPLGREKIGKFVNYRDLISSSYAGNSMAISCKYVKPVYFLLQANDGGTWLVYSYRTIPDYGEITQSIQQQYLAHKYAVHVRE